MRTIDEMSGFRLGWDLCRSETAAAAVAQMQTSLCSPTSSSSRPSPGGWPGTEAEYSHAGVGEGVRVRLVDDGLARSGAKYQLPWRGLWSHVWVLGVAVADP